MTDRFRVVEREPAWGQGDSLLQPRSAAFWVYVALFGLGAVLIVQRVAPAMRVNVGATSLALVLWALYAIPFLCIIVWLDLLEPEPPAFLATGFAWGAVVAVSVAIIANTSTQSIMTKTLGVEFTRTWWSALSGPTTEETLKVLGLVVVVLVARRQVTTLLDGLVYGLVIGLGFQVAENFVYAADRLSTAIFSASPGRAVLDVFLFRGVALGLWSHAVYTAIAGAGIAYAIVNQGAPRWRRGAAAAGAIATAWVLHFVWNAPFTQPESAGGLAAADIPLYVAKGLPALVLVLVLIRIARGREVEWFTDVLTDEGECVTQRELEVLITANGRRMARAEARRQGGRQAADAVQRLQRAQTRLAVARATAKEPTEPAVEIARQRVRSARSTVTALQRRVEVASSGSSGT